MSRINQFFKDHPERKALISFLTAGDPTLEHTVAALHALVEGGVDILEVGVPFSDPEAEGPAIQASSERALRNGTTLARVLQMIAEFRQTNTHTPIVLMGYLNSILAMADFPARARDAGVDGLIMVNLPPESAAELQQQLQACQIDLIYLVAPTTTDERARFILHNAAGFVYYVSLKGITGADNLDTDTVSARINELRQFTRLPLCVGFGIKTPDTAEAVAEFADGVVVGSALVNLLTDYADDVAAGCAALTRAALALREGVDRGTQQALDHRTTGG
ncbi:MAG: tryptophan synthase subunit alpha [bacterium]